MYEKNILEIITEEGSVWIEKGRYKKIYQLAKEYKKENG